MLADVSEVCVRAGHADRKGGEPYVYAWLFSDERSRRAAELSVREMEALATWSWRHSDEVDWPLLSAEEPRRPRFVDYLRKVECAHSG